jgi:hypothetical protein
MLILYRHPAVVELFKVAYAHGLEIEDVEFGPTGNTFPKACAEQNEHPAAALVEHGTEVNACGIRGGNLDTALYHMPLSLTSKIMHGIYW